MLLGVRKQILTCQDELFACACAALLKVLCQLADRFSTPYNFLIFLF